MDATEPLRCRRIAMWSPPRARSTMMMRVFEALGCAVFDEPFYAYWLATVRKTDDPGYAKTIAVHETDWRQVIDQILAPFPDGKDWYYQKHMALHMLEEVDLSWMSRVRNCFLIRHPAEVIVSMSEFRNLAPKSEAEVRAAAELVGIPQLRRIYDRAVELSGEAPPVLDANDVLADPIPTLRAFTERIGMPFDPDAPISWAAGRHPSDGAWADDWYAKVYETTGLGAYTRKETEVPNHLLPLLEHCLPTYEYIAAQRLRGEPA